MTYSGAGVVVLDGTLGTLLLMSVDEAGFGETGASTWRSRAFAFKPPSPTCTPDWSPSAPVTKSKGGSPRLPCGCESSLPSAHSTLDPPLVLVLVFSFVFQRETSTFGRLEGEMPAVVGIEAAIFTDDEVDGFELEAA